MTPEEIRERLSEFIGRETGGRRVDIAGLKRMPGGASREIWQLDVTCDDGSGERTLPALEGPKKFHARVAANVMSILAREWQLEEDQVQAEWESLTSLLGVAPDKPWKRDDVRAVLRNLTEELCGRIRNGDADDGAWRTALLAHLRLVVRQKLEVASPAMLESEAR